MRKPYSKELGPQENLNHLMKLLLKANDIGQFSDIDLKDFIKNKNNYIQVITIGDSMAEALQVRNSSTFHGILNNKTTQKKEKIISTSISASGMAFPNYIASINYAKTLTDLNEIIIVIPIIANDFDESFQKYAIKGRRGGSGQFYFNNTSEKMDLLKCQRQNLTQTSIGALLKEVFDSLFIYNLKLTKHLSKNLNF